jgi:hypothetical protein
MITSVIVPKKQAKRKAEDYDLEVDNVACWGIDESLLEGLIVF